MTAHAIKCHLHLAEVCRKVSDWPTGSTHTQELPASSTHWNEETFLPFKPSPQCCRSKLLSRVRGMSGVCTTATHTQPERVLVEQQQPCWKEGWLRTLENARLIGKDGICYDMIWYSGHRNSSATELWRSQPENSIFLPHCIGIASETKYLCFVWTLSFSHTLCRSYSAHLNTKALVFFLHLFQILPPHTEAARVR